MGVEAAEDLRLDELAGLAAGSAHRGSVEGAEAAGGGGWHVGTVAQSEACFQATAVAALTPPSGRAPEDVREWGVTERPSDRLQSLFAAAADPVQAESMARYLKGGFPFHGIPAGPRRELQRQAFAGRRLDRAEAEAEVAVLAGALWALSEREYQYAACDLLRAAAPRASAGLLPLIERLAVTKPWWDTVDSLAHAAGTLVLAHPELGARMDELAQSPDPWLVRIALLHQLEAYGRTDSDRLLRTCAAHAGSSEFFVRKAIGWALRQYAKTDPAVVRAFVEAHPELSPLSRREALKGLPL